jgi:hypothetical protein
MCLNERPLECLVCHGKAAGRGRSFGSACVGRLGPNDLWGFFTAYSHKGERQGNQGRSSEEDYNFSFHSLDNQNIEKWL